MHIHTGTYVDIIYAFTDTHAHVRTDTHRHMHGHTCTPTHTKTHVQTHKDTHISSDTCAYTTHMWTHTICVQSTRLENSVMKFNVEMQTPGG